MMLLLRSVAIAVCVVSFIPPATAASWFELNFGLSGPRYDALVPLCDDPGVLRQIRSKFAEKETEYWNSNLEIRGIAYIGQLAFRPWVSASNSVPRRFCGAVATLTDGASRDLRYAIGENTGWLGVGWGVEWCVAGLDRDWAFGSFCNAAVP